jgi:hypothetical protein
MAYREARRGLAIATAAAQVLIRPALGLQFRASPVRAIEKPGQRALAEKFVRGLHFAETGTLLGDIDVRAAIVHNRGPDPNAAHWAPLFDLLRQVPSDERLGPGLWYRRYDGTNISDWAFLLWGSVEIVALVKPH